LREADHADLIIAAPDEHQEAQPRPTPTDRGLPYFAVALAVVDIEQAVSKSK